MCGDIKYYLRLWKRQAVERKEDEDKAEKRLKMLPKFRVWHSEMPFSNLHDLQAKPKKHKYLAVVWEDGEHHEVRFPLYLLEAQCQK